MWVVQAMQNIMQNPEFAKMAEDLGKKMFENDPQLASMVQARLPPTPCSLGAETLVSNCRLRALGIWLVP